jgi:hypothetical protein
MFHNIIDILSRRQSKTHRACGYDVPHMVDQKFWRCLRCNRPVAVMAPASC